MSRNIYNKKKHVAPSIPLT